MSVNNYGIINCFFYLPVARIQYTRRVTTRKKKCHDTLLALKLIKFRDNS